MKPLTYATMLTGAMCASAALAHNHDKDVQRTSDAQATTQQSQSMNTQETQQTITNQQSATSKQHSGQQANADQTPRTLLVVGEVIDSRDVKLKDTAASQHRLLKVRTSEGNQVVVDIGVARGEIADVDFEKGDRIVAVGKAARINDRPVLFAQTVGEIHSAGVASNQPRNTRTAQGEQQRQSSEIRRAAADEATEESPKD